MGVFYTGGRILMDSPRRALVTYRALAAYDEPISNNGVVMRKPIGQVLVVMAAASLALLTGCGRVTSGATPAGSITPSASAASVSSPSSTPSVSSSASSVSSASVTPSQTAAPTPAETPTSTQPPTPTETAAPAETPSPAVTSSAKPTLIAGPALFEAGDKGDEVRAIQVRLRQIGWYAGTISGTYDAKTVTSIKGFQAKRGFPVTGEIDKRTLDKLVSMTRTPTDDEKNNVAPAVQANTAIDSRCMTGRVLCIDKSTLKLRWVVNGEVQKVLDVRFGSNKTPTREGSFSVFQKSRDHVSTIYDTAMPFAMFFSGGQAVHYSSDFAARGYNGASHGCVNVRDYKGIVWLFDQVRIGDTVIVYRS